MTSGRYEFAAVTVGDRYVVVAGGKMVSPCVFVVMAS